MTTQCPKCKAEIPSDSKSCKECATPLPSVEDAHASLTKTLKTSIQQLAKGTVFANRYEVIETLGKGGMGEVYRVKDKKLDEEMALKILKPEIAAYKETIERFKNELKLARKIAHRNVCKMYDLNEEGEIPFITMEYVEGEDLKSLIKRKAKLTEKEAITLAKQICEGLSEAHRLGVVHRDLKPKNIMIDEEGNAKVMDFGIARSIEASGVTQTGVMIGTPDYISPEQAGGEEADQRSDIYSLGVILYEMVSGKVPFKGDTALSVALKHKAQLPQEPKKQNPEISENMNRLILVCMEKDRKRRYQSAIELLDDLKNIEERFPLGTKIRPKRATFASTLIQKKFVILGLLVALAIIMVVTWWLLLNEKVVPSFPGKPSVAIMYFKNNTGDKTFDFWKTALSDSLITDLSQSKHFKVLSGDKLYQILNDMNQLESSIYSADVLEEVALRGEVTHIIQGNFAKAGDTFRIDITIQESNTGNIIGSGRVEGEGEESMFAMVDELTREIKADFRIKPLELSRDIDKEVADITTSSQEAYKYYIEAKEYLQKREFRQSLVLFEKAVTVDPEFAMAYKDMAFAHQGLGNEVEMRNYFEKALALTDRISDKEQYVVQVTYYLVSERDYPKAIAACQELLEIYPDDQWGNARLGAMYSDIEEWNKAADQFQILVQIDPENPQNHTSLASAYLAMDLNDKVQEVLDGYLEEYADDASIHYYLAINYISQRKFESARIEVEKYVSLNPGKWRAKVLFGDIAYFQNRFTEAENEYKELVDGDDWAGKVYGQERLASMALIRGKYEDSEKNLNYGIDLAKKSPTWASFFYARKGYLNQKTGHFTKALKATETSQEKAFEGRNRFSLRIALYVKCCALIAMNSMTEAKKVAEELKAEIEEGSTWKAIRFYYLVIGLIKLKEECYTEAIQYFEKAAPLLPGPQYISEVFNDHALFLEPLALAYFSSGDLGRARDRYEAITRLTYGQIYYDDVYAQAFYMLGKIYEQQGNLAKAIEHYERFLDLWKDADPGIAEVDDAREALKRLKKD